MTTTTCCRRAEPRGRFAPTVVSWWYCRTTERQITQSIHCGPGKCTHYSPGADEAPADKETEETMPTPTGIEWDAPTELTLPDVVDEYEGIPLWEWARTRILDGDTIASVARLVGCTEQSVVYAIERRSIAAGLDALPKRDRGDRIDWNSPAREYVQDLDERYTGTLMEWLDVESREGRTPAQLAKRSGIAHNKITAALHRHRTHGTETEPKTVSSATPPRVVYAAPDVMAPAPGPVAAPEPPVAATPMPPNPLVVAPVAESAPPAVAMSTPMAGAFSVVARCFIEAYHLTEDFEIFALGYDAGARGTQEVA